MWHVQWIHCMHEFNLSNYMYIKGRQARVDMFAPWSFKRECDLLQGSILGLPLFCLYITDQPSCTRNSRKFMYSDIKGGIVWCRSTKVSRVVCPKIKMNLVRREIANTTRKKARNCTRLGDRQFNRPSFNTAQRIIVVFVACNVLTFNWK